VAKAKSKKRHYRRKTTISVATVAGFGPLVASGIRGWQAETFRGAGKEMLYALTGVDIDNEPHFNPGFMVNGTIPILGGFAIHKVANMIGLNRALARMGVPLLRL